MGDFISRWNARQYVDDVRYGNAPLRRVLWGIGVGIFNLGQAASRRVLPRWLRIKDGLTYPFIVTGGRSTPAVTLGLEPGDWVRVKSVEEIGKTLDKDQRNRGLYFEREMMKYCGQTAQVLRRVDRIVEETTGRMITDEDTVHHSFGRNLYCRLPPQLPSGHLPLLARGLVGACCGTSVGR